MSHAQKTTINWFWPIYALVMLFIGYLIGYWILN